MDDVMYEELVQDGLRSVVKTVLSQVEKHGLVGSNYYYITFETSYPGVIVPDALKEKFPEVITIVLQHQFWDLKVADKNFSVALSFFDQNETLVVPYASMINFTDPSVKFSLDFTPPYYDGDALGAEPEESMSLDAAQNSGDDGEKVVSLDAFRKK